MFNKYFEKLNEAELPEVSSAKVKEEKLPLSKVIKLPFGLHYASMSSLNYELFRKKPTELKSLGLTLYGDKYSGKEEVKGKSIGNIGGAIVTSGGNCQVFKKSDDLVKTVFYKYGFRKFSDYGKCLKSLKGDLDTAQ